MSGEANLWKWLRGARLHDDNLQMTRIENSVVAGMPDVEAAILFAHLGCRQVWLELKAAARPGNRETPVRLKVRTKQVEWMRKRWRLGGRAFFLVQVGSGAGRALYLLDGDCGQALKTGMTEDMMITAARHSWLNNLDPGVVLHMAARSDLGNYGT